MPQMDGLELARKVRAVNSTVPIIIATADEKPVAEAQRLGYLVLKKPFSISDMTTIIAKATSILKTRKKEGQPQKRGEREEVVSKEEQNLGEGGLPKDNFKTEHLTVREALEALLTIELPLLEKDEAVK
jgi:DNA-binding NtrC family response regulator